MKPANAEPLCFDAAVEALLASCSLPAADLREGRPVHFFGIRQDGIPAGVFGIETFGTDGLLRSLAVAGPFRKHGYGRMLVGHAEHWAKRQGVEALYLLTTTAASFFTSLGYCEVPRSAAPAAIAGTTQFSGLCPSSSS
jgi:amino-acid N-acetyltransferase